MSVNRTSVGTESNLLHVVACHYHRCRAICETAATGNLWWWSVSSRKALRGCLPDAHAHQLLGVVVGDAHELAGGGSLGCD
jgi:hypothetical protein